MTPLRLARIAAVLFAATAVLFAFGTSSESSHSDERSETTEHHDEAVERDEGHDGATAESGHDENATVLGIDVESPATVALAVVGSLALATGLWFRPLRLLAVVAAVAGIAFAAVDLAELSHQLDESKAGLAFLAAVVALGHTGAATASGLCIRNRNLV